MKRDAFRRLSTTWFQSRSITLMGAAQHRRTLLSAVGTFIQHNSTAAAAACSSSSSTAVVYTIPSNTLLFSHRQVSTRQDQTLFSSFRRQRTAVSKQSTTAVVAAFLLFFGVQHVLLYVETQQYHAFYVPGTYSSIEFGRIQGSSRSRF